MLLLAASTTDRLTDLVSASGWTYALIVALVAADAVLPLVPGEAVVITAAVAAVDGDLSIVLVFAAAAAGCFLGDNTSYAIGRGALGRGARALLTRGERGRQLLQWAEKQLRERGRVVIVAARFIPGGRTATTFACGTIGVRWRWFAGADAVAAVLWAAYTVGIGALGGEAFRDQTWEAIATSLAIATLVTLAAEAVRRTRSHHRG